MSVCATLQGELSTGLTIGFGSGISGPQRMNRNDFGDLLMTVQNDYPTKFGTTPLN